MSGEGIAVVSLLESQDSRAGAANAERIGDLRERAHMIAQKTGAQPMSWSEFQQRTPVERPNYVGNMLTEGVKWAAIIGVIGAALSAIFYGGTSIGEALLPGFGMGAFLGGALGAASGLYKETTTTKRGDLMGEYETYLNQLEMGVARTPAQAQGITYRDDHAARLQETQGQFVTR